MKVLHGLEGRRPVLGFADDLVPLFFEERPRAGPEAGVVVDDENCHAHSVVRLTSLPNTVSHTLSSASSSLFASVLLRGRLGSGRNLHVEDGALPAVRLDPDPPVHASDELAGDVEAQAGATDPAGHVRVEPVELLEDPALLGGWDAEPLVGDGETHIIAGGLQAEVDVPARR